MLFRVNTSLNKFYVFGLALLFTVALAGCGGGGGSKKAMDTDTGTPPATGLTDAEQCVADEGRVEEDGSCTSAADVAQEIADAAAAAVADKTKAAGTKADAIGDEYDQSGREPTTPVSAAVYRYTPVVGYSYTISRDRDGITVKVTEADAADADPQIRRGRGF